MSNDKPLLLRRLKTKDGIVSSIETVIGDGRKAARALLGDARLTTYEKFSGGNSGKDKFTFIDLFAGIGGIRLGLERNGGKCIFSSEWDNYCQKTYKAWFDEVPHGDITKINFSTIPNHDILAAGFPCQPFSIAGVSKKNSLGRAHGFNCLSQGTLFFHRDASEPIPLIPLSAAGSIATVSEIQHRR